MTFQETLLSRIEDQNPEAKKADGFDAAIIGIGYTACKSPVLVYSYEKCIEILESRDGMDHDDAVEFFDFNVQDAYVGEGTPMFMQSEV